MLVVNTRRVFQFCFCFFLSIIANGMSTNNVGFVYSLQNSLELEFPLFNNSSPSVTLLLFSFHLLRQNVNCFYFIFNNYLLLTLNICKNRTLLICFFYFLLLLLFLVQIIFFIIINVCVFILFFYSRVILFWLIVSRVLLFLLLLILATKPTRRHSSAAHKNRITARKKTQ